MKNVFITLGILLALYWGYFAYEKLTISEGDYVEYPNGDYTTGAFIRKKERVNDTLYLRLSNDTLIEARNVKKIWPITQAFEKIL